MFFVHFLLIDIFGSFRLKKTLYIKYATEYFENIDMRIFNKLWITIIIE